MANTDKLTLVATTIQEYIETDKETLGIKDTWYGDERLIPRTPAISVVPGSKVRELTNTGQMTTITFRVVINIFHSRLEKSNITRKDCDEFAEVIENYLHQNNRLVVDGNALLVHSYVESMEPGIASTTTGSGQRVMIKASRLMWVGKSRVPLLRG